ncbi:hypothetical protein C8R43DRAFT_951576 [Mycena crocata]|nr:hypothetical protein C8R43DRAFT_951576 [Mycena crocata]
MSIPAWQESCESIASSLAETLGLVDNLFPSMTDEDRQAADNTLHVFIEIDCDKKSESEKWRAPVVANLTANFLHPLVAAYRLHGAGGCYGTAMLLVIQSPYFVKFLRNKGRGLFVHHARKMAKLITVDLSYGLELSAVALISWLRIFVQLNTYAKLFPQRVRGLPTQTCKNVLKWSLRVKNETVRRILTTKEHRSNVASNDVRFLTPKPNSAASVLSEYSQAVIALCTCIAPLHCWVFNILPSSNLRESNALGAKQQFIVAKNISGLTGQNTNYNVLKLPSDFSVPTLP